MTYQFLKIEKSNHIAFVTFDRPRRFNALIPEFMDEIIAVCRAFRSDTETRVIVFTGSGRSFCTGMDVGDENVIRQKEVPLLQLQRDLQRGAVMIREIYELNQITIAAINGMALGGGACIATACDFRIGAENCQVGYPESNLGMNLSWRALPLCVHLIGPARAKKMVILGQREKAETLLNWGFLDAVVPKKELLEAARQMAAAYAAQAPIAAQMIKRSVNQLVSALDQSIMHMDSDQFILGVESEDSHEAMQAFLDKRKPEFKGR
jgi:enoyl-CoA hydratase/carnithine racemase